MSDIEQQLEACKFVGDLKPVVRQQQRLIFELQANEKLLAAGLDAAVAAMKRFDVAIAKLAEKAGVAPEELFPQDDEPPYVPAEEQLAPPAAEAVTDAPSESSNAEVAEDAEDAEAKAEEPGDRSQEATVEPPADKQAAAEPPPAELNKPAPKRRKT